jgi:hypothetical protein
MSHINLYRNTSLLFSYGETPEHSLNFIEPPLEEIDGAKEYYVVEILSH